MLIPKAKYFLKVINVRLEDGVCCIDCEGKTLERILGINKNPKIGDTFIVPIRFVEENRVIPGGFYVETQDGECSYRPAL